MVTKNGFSARVVLEATGVYGLDLALALHRAKRVEVMVANPRAMGQFAGAFLRRSKTDALDANIIVEFAIRMEFEAWNPPEPHAFDLRAVSRRIEGMTKMATQEKNRLHAATSFDEMSEIVRNDIKVNIRHLERRIDRMREQARELIAEHPDLDRAFLHITSVKGIAQAAGIQILAELAVLPEDMDVRQWVAHAGLDPRVFQSGTSVNKAARISRQGNVHMRRALFMPVLVAVQHEPNVRAFHRKLVARGKTKMQANVAVMRKLLHAIYGMLKHDRDFEGEKFYAIGA
jgi:transposase